VRVYNIFVFLASHISMTPHSRVNTRFVLQLLHLRLLLLLCTCFVSITLSGPCGGVSQLMMNAFSSSAAVAVAVVSRITRVCMCVYIYIYIYICFADRASSWARIDEINSEYEREGWGCVNENNVVVVTRAAHSTGVWSCDNIATVVDSAHVLGEMRDPRFRIIGKKIPLHAVVTTSIGMTLPPLSSFCFLFYIIFYFFVSFLVLYVHFLLSLRLLFHCLLFPVQTGCIYVIMSFSRPIGVLCIIIIVYRIALVINPKLSTQSTRMTSPRKFHVRLRTSEKSSDADSQTTLRMDRTHDRIS
jgi:hypothetical protein